MGNQISFWKGSQRTAALVRQAIAERWGEEAAGRYDPRKNCFTFAGWKKLGYHVKKGEKSIPSITFIRKKVENEETGEERWTSYPRTVHLFFDLQVEPI